MCEQVIHEKNGKEWKMNNIVNVLYDFFKI